MVARLRKCDKISGFLYGIFLLLKLSANCSGDVLNQTKIMLTEMQEEAKELFIESFTEHDVSELTCKEPYPHTTQKSFNKVTQRINESLTDFIKAFSVLLSRHEESEYNHTKNLKKAKEKIAGLRNNLSKLYKYKWPNKLHEPLNAVLRIKVYPPNSDDIYDQKLECCQLINVYVNFLDVVHRIVLKILPKRSKKTFSRTNCIID
ncbi:uncharacterized protein LOC130308704 [Hyla sarda]|uniref:uncharacterized protein LOC130308704 n=1 Tax=Hyla sarda TaxID=327740 RepID=UPI0024C22F3F|nr:uncharacterized protein LOC130308704 [Hyla sarda]